MDNCNCCGEEETEENRLGVLQMPQRRAFLVCQNCVNFMWHGRSQFKNFDVLEG